MEIIGIIAHYTILVAWTSALAWGHFKSLHLKKEQEQQIKELCEAISRYDAKSRETLLELDSQAQRSVDNHLRDVDHLLYRVWALESKLETTNDKLDKSWYEIQAWFAKRK